MHSSNLREIRGTNSLSKLKEIHTASLREIRGTNRRELWSKSEFWSESEYPYSAQISANVGNLSVDLGCISAGPCLQGPPGCEDRLCNRCSPVHVSGVFWYPSWNCLFTDLVSCLMAGLRSAIWCLVTVDWTPRTRDEPNLTMFPQPGPPPGNLLKIIEI